MATSRSESRRRVTMGFGTCPEPGGCSTCPDPKFCRTLRIDYGVTTEAQEADWDERRAEGSDRG